MGKRILVVDDDYAFAEMVKVALAAKGYEEVEVCLQPKSAFPKIREWRPDLVTLDVMMPGHSGWDVVSQIRSDRTVASTPVLLTTGSRGTLTADEDAVLHGMRYEKLLKPFELDELYSCVDRLLQEEEGQRATQG